MSVPGRRVKAITTEKRSFECEYSNKQQLQYYRYVLKAYLRHVINWMDTGSCLSQMSTFVDASVLCNPAEVQSSLHPAVASTAGT